MYNFKYYSYSVYSHFFSFAEFNLYENSKFLRRNMCNYHKKGLNNYGEYEKNRSKVCLVDNIMLGNKNFTLTLNTAHLANEVILDDYSHQNMHMTVALWISNTYRQGWTKHLKKLTPLNDL